MFGSTCRISDGNAIHASTNRWMPHQRIHTNDLGHNVGGGRRRWGAWQSGVRSEGPRSGIDGRRRSKRRGFWTSSWRRMSHYGHSVTRKTMKTAHGAVHGGRHFRVSARATTPAGCCAAQSGTSARRGRRRLPQQVERRTQVERLPVPLGGGGVGADADAGCRQPRVGRRQRSPFPA